MPSVPFAGRASVTAGSPAILCLTAHGPSVPMVHGPSVPRGLKGRQYPLAHGPSVPMWLTGHQSPTGTQAVSTLEAHGPSVPRAHGPSVPHGAWPVSPRGAWTVSSCFVCGRSRLRVPIPISTPRLTRIGPTGSPPSLARWSLRSSGPAGPLVRLSESSVLPDRWQRRREPFRLDFGSVPARRCRSVRLRLA